MADPVVHFEIIGSDPERLADFYHALFGWKGTVSPTSEMISDKGGYHFIEPIAASGMSGIAGGIGGGPDRSPHLLLYVKVSNVAQALDRAESLGARRHLGPATNPAGDLVIGQFFDPEGNLVRVAGSDQ